MSATLFFSLTFWHLFPHTIWAPHEAYCIVSPFHTSSLIIIMPKLRSMCSSRDSGRGSSIGQSLASSPSSLHGSRSGHRNLSGFGSSLNLADDRFHLPEQSQLSLPSVNGSMWNVSRRSFGSNVSGSKTINQKLSRSSLNLSGLHVYKLPDSSQLSLPSACNFSMDQSSIASESTSSEERSRKKRPDSRSPANSSTLSDLRSELSGCRLASRSPEKDRSLLARYSAGIVRTGFIDSFTGEQESGHAGSEDMRNRTIFSDISASFIPNLNSTEMSIRLPKESRIKKPEKIEVEDILICGGCNRRFESLAVFQIHKESNKCRKCFCRDNWFLNRDIWNASEGFNTEPHYNRAYCIHFATFVSE